MDPNQALIDARTAVGSFRLGTQNESNDEEIEAALQLIESFDALDEWLTKGGFLPTAWQFDADETPPPCPASDDGQHVPMVGPTPGMPLGFIRVTCAECGAHEGMPAPHEVASYREKVLAAGVEELLTPRGIAAAEHLEATKDFRPASIVDYVTDYNVCPINPDGKHAPVSAHYDHEVSTGYVSVACEACGTTTGVPIPDELEWN